MTALAPDDSVRLAILTPRLPPGTGMGGIATAHFNLYSALLKAGWRVKAFAYQESRDAESATELRLAQSEALVLAIRRACGAALAVLSPFRRSYQLAEALSGALAGRRLREPLARYRPDVIIAPDKGCPLALIPKPPGARLIWMSHHNPMRFLGMDSSPPLSALDATLATRLEARGLAKADLVLCPSRAMREQFVRTYRFDGPVEIFPNLMSDDVEASAAVSPPLRQILRLADGAPLFYLPGAGTSAKGGRFLALLLAELGRRYPEAGVFVSGTVEPDYRVAAGSGPAHLRVFSPGALPHAENLARVRECDVALSPALLESFGMALLEAAWLGLPVAAFEAGGIPDIIGATEGGRNGVTVPVGDVVRLCDAGDSLLRGLRSGKLSRAQVAALTRERFATPRAIARLGALIHSLLGRTP
jgi:glycosyltransferase involved in cell wall biosynthesis